MSSDSEESHASAHSNRGGDSGDTQDSVDSPVQLQDRAEPSTPTQDSIEDEEVQSPSEQGSGTNGISFAKRRCQTEPDEDSLGSELAMRPAMRRPQSVESASTPDDTPSIQVG